MQISNPSSNYMYNSSTSNSLKPTQGANSFNNYLSSDYTNYSKSDETVYTQHQPLFNDYFQSPGIGQKKTSFNEYDASGDLYGVYKTHIEEEDIPKNEKGEKFLDIIPESVFEALPQEDAELFKNILEDSHVTYVEMDSLSYEQINTLNKIMFTDALTYGYSMDEIPLTSADTRVRSFFRAANFTNDDHFNQSVLKTVKEATNVQAHDISSALSEMQQNLMQIMHNKPFSESFKVGAFGGGEGYDAYFLSKSTMNIDYEELFVNALNLYGEGASKPQPSESITEQFKRGYEWYYTLRDNYETMENKEVYV